MKRPRLLDLFCGAGGAAMGYHRAGFDVVGVDIKPQPHYPFEFIQADALQFVAEHGARFDAIHASPPCQAYSKLRHLPWLKKKTWPMLIAPCRRLLNQTERPWVMENVESAPIQGVMLCGTMFGLPTYRHRLFESTIYLWNRDHAPHAVKIGQGRMINDRKKGTLNNSSGKGAWGNQQIIAVYGSQFKKSDGARALQIDWMTTRELAQAIPPAYTEFIGTALLRYLDN